MTRRGPYKRRPTAGTLRALIAAFRESAQYRGWAPNTRATKERQLRALEKHNGDWRLDEMTRGHVVRLRDSLSDTPSEANAFVAAIRMLYDHALDLEWTESNPAATVKRLRRPNARDGIRTWQDHEIEAYFERHPAGSPAHTCATVLLYTGAARVDAVRLGWPNVRDGRIRYHRQKLRWRGGAEISIPILPPLWAVLETLRDRLTFLQTEKGRPRTPGGLSQSMKAWAIEAGLDADLTCHGLRKACARRLVEAGSPIHEVMAWLGQESPAQAAHYARAYDRERATDHAAERLGNISPPKVTRIGPKKDGGSSA